MNIFGPAVFEYFLNVHEIGESQATTQSDELTPQPQQLLQPQTMEEETDWDSFPFGHILGAVRHTVGQLTWRPPAETPVKGQSYLLQTLPYDVQHLVIQSLDYPAFLALQATSRFFYELTTAVSLPRVTAQDFVQEKNNNFHTSVYLGLYACSECLKFLPKEKFPRKACRPGSSKRHCIDCSAKLGLYEPEPGVWFGKLLYHFCRGCKSYTTPSRRCTRELTTDGDGKRKIVYRCNTPPPRKKSHLETMPVHILRNITRSLDYDDVLRTQQTCKALNEKLDRTWVPLRIRFRHIHTLWQQHPERAFDDWKFLPCFSCFLFRPVEKFTSRQRELARENPVTNWKLRCGACVQRMHSRPLHPWRREWKRRRICNVCSGLRLIHETCYGCAELHAEGKLGRKVVCPPEVDYADNLQQLDNIFDTAEF